MFVTTARAHAAPLSWTVATRALLPLGVQDEVPRDPDPTPREEATSRREDPTPGDTHRQGGLAGSQGRSLPAISHNSHAITTAIAIASPREGNYNELVLTKHNSSNLWWRMTCEFQVQGGDKILKVFNSLRKKVKPRFTTTSRVTNSIKKLKKKEK